MFRRSNRWHSRFDQPDPYDGSYSLTNPQSFNRYAYVQNDPVNFVDPNGLDPFPFGLIGPLPSTVTIYGSFDSPLGINGSGGVGVSDRDVMLDIDSIGGVPGRGTSPQNAPLDVNRLRSGLETFLAETDCAKFLGALLRSLPSPQGTTERFNGTLMDNFNRIKSFGIGPHVRAAASVNNFTMHIDFDMTRVAPILNSNKSWHRIGVTEILIHELIHVFTEQPSSGIYTHSDMARAASVASTQVRNGWTGKLPGPGDDQAFSNYFMDSLAFACRKVKFK